MRDGYALPGLPEPHDPLTLSELVRGALLSSQLQPDEDLSLFRQIVAQHVFRTPQKERSDFRLYRWGGFAIGSEQTRTQEAEYRNHVLYAVLVWRTGEPPSPLDFDPL